MIYSPVNYQLAGNYYPLSGDSSASAEPLEGMKARLRRWLDYRNRVTATAGSGRFAVARAREEQPLAEKLHKLLLEQGFSTDDLPTPNTMTDPNVAVTLARMVLDGVVPNETPQGIVPFLVLGGVAAVLWMISRSISAYTELQVEREKYRCIQSGACTDTGFWVKAAGVAVIGYIGWNVWKRKGRLS